MLHLLETQNQNLSHNYTKPALVTRIEDDKLWVRIEHASSNFVLESINSLSYQDNFQPEIGDQVLVTGENHKICYIIGVIHCVNKLNNKKLVTKNGAQAKSIIKDSKECIQVQDEEGYVLFEYNSDSKQSKIFAPQGDLSINALNGDIELNSAKNIKCHSIGAVDIQSNTAAQIRVSGKNQQSSINVSNQATSIQSEHFALSSKQANVDVHNTDFKGDELNTVLRHSKAVIHKIETKAEKIMESAKNIYRKVEELSQTKAKRMRYIIKNDYQLKTNSTTIHAKQNVNVDGEKINLG